MLGSETRLRWSELLYSSGNLIPALRLLNKRLVLGLRCAHREILGYAWGSWLLTGSAEVSEPPIPCPLHITTTDSPRCPLGFLAFTTLPKGRSGSRSGMEMGLGINSEVKICAMAWTDESYWFQYRCKGKVREIRLVMM